MLYVVLYGVTLCYMMFMDAYFILSHIHSTEFSTVYSAPLQAKRFNTVLHTLDTCRKRDDVDIWTRVTDPNKTLSSYQALTSCFTTLKRTNVCDRSGGTKKWVTTQLWQSCCHQFHFEGQPWRIEKLEIPKATNPAGDWFRTSYSGQVPKSSVGMSAACFPHYNPSDLLKSLTTSFCCLHQLGQYNTTNCTNPSLPHQFLFSNPQKLPYHSCPRSQ